MSPSLRRCWRHSRQATNARRGFVRPVALDKLLTTAEPASSRPGSDAADADSVAPRKRVGKPEARDGRPSLRTGPGVICRAVETSCRQRSICCGIVFAGDRDPTGLYAVARTARLLRSQRRPRIRPGRTRHPDPGRSAPRRTPRSILAAPPSRSIDGKTLAIFGELRPDIATRSRHRCAAGLCRRDRPVGGAGGTSSSARGRDGSAFPAGGAGLRRRRRRGDPGRRRRSGATELAPVHSRPNVSLFDIYRGPQIGEGRKSHGLPGHLHRT